MLENETLAQQAAMNSKEQFALGDFQHVLMDNVIAGLDHYQAMAGQVMGNERIQKVFRRDHAECGVPGVPAAEGGGGVSERKRLTTPTKLSHNPLDTWVQQPVAPIP